MGIGGALFGGASKLFDGPLGVVKVGFKGYDLGKTTAEAILKPDHDLKDITYQQDGTKASDRVRTGITLMFTATFGEIKTGLLKLLMAGITSGNTDPADDYGVIGRSVYQSQRDNEAGVLRIAACDENGVASTDEIDNLYFYEAIANIKDNLINWGADSQRNLQVEFSIFFHEFAPGESLTKVGAFGYWGNPTDNDVPAAAYPDLAKPYITAIHVTSATNMDVTFDQNISEVAAASTEQKCIAKVDGVFVAPTNAGTSGAVLSLTFAAATFAVGDVVELSMSENVIKDGATPANVNEAVNGRSVTNDLV